MPDITSCEEDCKEPNLTYRNNGKGHGLNLGQCLASRNMEDILFLSENISSFPFYFFFPTAVALGHNHLSCILRWSTLGLI